MSFGSLQIFDTLTGAKRLFVPIVDGEVRMYVCGVTVYDFAHIGHARTFATFDTVVRYLRHRGWKVTFVRNHTDIDDKIIHRANERGEDPVALASRFVEAFDVDMARLGLLAPDVAPRVTQTIPEILSLVQQLIDRGHAYAVDGDVYYAVDSFAEYGKLSHRKLEDMRAGERVAVDERKRNPFDFALWKSAKPGEPSWESPWGPGRPGWHIECSAMSIKYLGHTFDIHGGGSDLQFPHHENEIAQSEGATGCTFANWWMHSAMLNVDGEKMSKSIGNFWTLRDVLDQHHPETIRYFFLTAQYRKPVNYSTTNLEAARERVRYLHRAARLVRELWARRGGQPDPDPATLEGLRGRLYAALDDDFNTPVALAVVNEAARLANELLTAPKLAKQPLLLARLSAIDAFLAIFAELFTVLSSDSTETLRALRLQVAQQAGVDPAWVEARIADRHAARRDRNFALADEIRAEITRRGVDLMDGPQDTDWDMAARNDGSDDSGNVPAEG